LEKEKRPPTAFLIPKSVSYFKLTAACNPNVCVSLHQNGINLPKQRGLRATSVQTSLDLSISWQNENNHSDKPNAAKTACLACKTSFFAKPFAF